MSDDAPGGERALLLGAGLAFTNLAALAGALGAIAIVFALSFRAGDWNLHRLLLTGVVQSLPRLAMPNGGVYATRRQTLFADNLLIAPRTGLHIMPLERSVDIDEPIDFEFAEFMARRTEENPK